VGSLSSNKKAPRRFGGRLRIVFVYALATIAEPKWLANKANDDDEDAEHVRWFYLARAPLSTGQNPKLRFASHCEKSCERESGAIRALDAAAGCVVRFAHMNGSALLSLAILLSGTPQA